jgi:hypothetical protein
MTSFTTTFGRRSGLAALGCFLAAAVLLCAAGSAQAYQYVPHTLEKTVTSAENNNFRETSSLAVDEQTGDVYLLAAERPEINVYKFDAQGNPANFASTGTPVLSVPTNDTFSEDPAIAVDNSGGPHQGRIYVENAFITNAIWAYEPSGEEVHGNFPIMFVQGGPEKIATSHLTGNFFTMGTPLSEHVYEFNPEGKKTGKVVNVSQLGYTEGHLAIGPNDEPIVYNAYAPYRGIMKFTSSGELTESIFTEYSGVYGVDQISGEIASAREEEAVIYNSEGDELPATEYPYTGEPIATAVNGANHYIYVATSQRLQVLAPEPTVTLGDARIEPSTSPEAYKPTEVTLKGSVNPNGVPTTSCYFEVGSVVEYGYVYYEEVVPCEQGEVLSGGSPTPVTAQLSGLTKGGSYHYRLVLGNANGNLRTNEKTISPSAKPIVEEAFISEPHADSALFHFEVTPEGAPTTYHVLYGTGDCLTEPQTCSESPESKSVGAGQVRIPLTYLLTGLEKETTYDYVVVATNQSGSGESAQGTFTTFPTVEALEDNCSNAHVRQQTGAALLADCRAYELVSAANSGGYNVESYLAEEQQPFGGYPEAEGPTRVLYGVHDGAIPGTGNPTNHGLDPYVATRGTQGWSTKYVGIPANTPYSNEAFASPLAGADSSLDTFVFGGSNLCSPCFEDGSTGVPVTLSDGSLVQGMQGPLKPGNSATAGMLVKKSLSADGSHLIFGSTSEFETGAGTPAIYDRDLGSSPPTTQAISKLPAGGSIPCLMDCNSDGLAELDISSDGTHVVIGQLISVDSAGNHYWHLYMNVDDSAKSIDLSPGTTTGALYDGMTENGSTVYMTSADKLTGEDTDTSADLYEAQVGASSAVLKLVSKGSGGTGNSDSCAPLGNSVNSHWNTVVAAADCSVVAVGGGGGVAAQSGTVYFLSPELLDGSAEPADGRANQPNLYRYTPGGVPKFVSTLESSATGPNPPLEEHRFLGTFGAAQNPEFTAVDNSGGPSDGDVYVAETNGETIRKYDPEGNLVTSWQNNGVFEPEIFGTSSYFEQHPDKFGGIAVGPNGDLWVGLDHELNACCDIFKYDEDGNLVTERELDGTVFPIGIAVDSHENLYYMGYYEYIERWHEGEGSHIVSTWEYESPAKKGLAVDPATGELYVGFGGIELARFEFDSAHHVIQSGGGTCTSECNPTQIFGLGEVGNTAGMFIDPSHNDLYVDEGNKILRYTSGGQRAAGPDVGAKVLANSSSVAVSSTGDLYATNAGSAGANIAHFGPLVLAPDARTDSPIVIDSVNESGTRHTGDFEITPSGQDAAFTSTIPLTGYDNSGVQEIYRYDAATEGLSCVSCNPTGRRPAGPSAMARDGLSLTDSGAVFFDSQDALLPSDLDNVGDVYEWEGGKTTLVSTGISPYDSSLLSADSGGKDVYFFTRDTLVPEDLNGKLVKIYDAREGGGYSYTPPEVGCKASDECHGASSQQPAPAAIGTYTGEGGNHVPGNEEPKACPKGRVRRHGKCVKHPRHRKGHHHKHGHAKKRSHGRSGGGQ